MPFQWAPTPPGQATNPAAKVFGNADGNLANFLWDGARCRIVDFEDSGVSDPAYEAAHVSRLL
jgi:thiamine kinase-like enzyme